MSTEKMLEERQSTHGEYSEHAEMTQRTLDQWMTGRNWGNLSYQQKESLHMMAHKVGRILTGDPDIPDHWDDIAGYSKLVSQRLPGGSMYSIIRSALSSAVTPTLPSPPYPIPGTHVPGTPEDGGHHARQDYDDDRTGDPPIPEFLTRGARIKNIPSKP